MNVLSRFTLRSLSKNRKWTIVTIIGIIISTAMLTAVATLTSSFLSMMQRFGEEDTGRWHAAFYGVSAEARQTLDGDSRIGDMMRIRELGYALLEGAENPSKPYLYIRQYDEAALEGMSIHLLEGRLPENDHELLISEQVFKNGGVKYSPGDTLTLTMGRRESGEKTLTQRSRYRDPKDYGEDGEVFVQDGTAQYTVVGVMARPGGGIEPYSSPGYTAIAGFAAGDEGVTDVYATAASIGKGLYEAMASSAEDAGLEASAVSFNQELLRYYGLIEDDDILQMLYTFAGVVIAIIMVASISLIYNAFSIAVSERLRQLGMLASVGATRAQKRYNVYLEGFLLGAVGIPAGILAGILGIGVTLRAVGPMLGTVINSDYGANLTLAVSPAAIGVAVLTAALTIFISVWIPARRASRTTPIDAIRQTKEIRLTSRVVRVPRVVRALFGFEGELALKNLRRSRRKYRATIISLTISVVLFLTVSTAAYYTQSGVDTRLTTQRINFDIYLGFQNAEDSQVSALFAAVKALPGVSESGESRSLNALITVPESRLPQVGNQFTFATGDGGYELNVSVMGLSGDGFERYAREIGENPADFAGGAMKGILVNRSVSYSMETKKYVESPSIRAEAGDTLELRYTNSRHEMNDYSLGASLTVGAVAEKLPIGGMTPEIGSVLLVVSEETYDLLIAHQLEGERADVRFLSIKSPDAAALDDPIQQILNSHETRSYIMMNLPLQARQETQVLLFMGVFLYGFITLISLICVANILNTVSTNIRLRRKEFAMLRSVGMTPKSFNRMLRFESLFYGLKALLWGLPISVAIGAYLYWSVNQGIDFGFYLPLREYGVAAALVFVIVGVTMLYSSARVKRENIIDALRDDTM